jgi:outer membrane protein assembly factor BamD (BamD/ComL family)
MLRNLIVFAVVILLAACTSRQEKMKEEIAAREKALYTDSSLVPDAGKAKEMIDLYTSYADAFPADTSGAAYLFKAADLSSKMNETSRAIQLFSRLIERFPEHRHAPYALFLQGFIYENQVGDPAKAKPYYEAFLKKYPDHPMAGDVSFSLENLGKTPEELIRAFENNGAGDTSQTASSDTISTR